MVTRSSRHVRRAVDAIGLLGPNDIVSIVTYDTNVQVLVPATKLTDREQVIEAIRGIQPTGNTRCSPESARAQQKFASFCRKTESIVSSCCPMVWPMLAHRLPASLVHWVRHSKKKTSVFRRLDLVMDTTKT